MVMMLLVLFKTVLMDIIRFSGGTWKLAADV
jgi:hypothetical protein